MPPSPKKSNQHLYDAMYTPDLQAWGAKTRKRTLSIGSSNTGYLYHNEAGPLDAQSDEGHPQKREENGTVTVLNWMTNIYLTIYFQQSGGN